MARYQEQDDQLDFFGRDTLSEEKLRVVREREEGTHCKACGQFAKVYPRTIHSTVAKTMISLALKFTDSYFHVTEVDRISSVARGDFHKAALWGLIEVQPTEERPANGARSIGMWKFTYKGLAFIRRQAKIPKIAFVYDDKVLGFSDEQIDIVGCLREKFDYYELMGQN